MGYTRKSPPARRNRGTPQSPNDEYIGLLVDAASTRSSVALSPADQALVNEALASAYGVAAVAAGTTQQINTLIDFATKTAARAQASDQNFATGAVAQWWPPCDSP